KRAEIIRRIGLLQDSHDIGSCTGCHICKEVRHLGDELEQTSKVSLILKKGKSMKRDDIIFLKDKEVPDKTIAEYMEVSKSTFARMKKELDIEIPYIDNSRH